MTKIEDRITRAAMRNGYKFTWQTLKFGYQRMEVSCESFAEFSAVLSSFQRMKGVFVDRWFNGDGGFFEGYVYVMDQVEHDAMQAEMQKERDRVEDWWQRYHVADAETRRLMACGAIQ